MVVVDDENLQQRSAPLACNVLERPVIVKLLVKFVLSSKNLVYCEVEQGPLESGRRSLCSRVQKVPNAIHQLVAVVNLVRVKLTILKKRSDRIF